MCRKRTGVVGFLALVLAFAAVLVLGGAESVSSTPGPTMRLDPALVEIDGFEGETFSVDVLIEDVTDLGGFEFEMHFDDSRTDVEINLGPFLGSAGGDVTCFNSVFGGTAAMGCVRMGAAPRPSGSGVVATIKFILTVPFGQTGPLNLVACGAADSNGVAIPLNGCKDGSYVGPTGGPIVTATPPPAPVGGIALDSDLRALPLNGAQGAAGGLTSRTGSLAAGVVAVLTMLATGWYARRRRLT